MVYVLVRHKVEDFDKWKAAYEGAKEFRISKGEKSTQLFRNADDPKELTILNEFENIEKAKAFMSLPELAEKMKEAGVSEKPEISFLEGV